MALQFDFSYAELLDALKPYVEDRGDKKIGLYLVIEEEDRLILKASLYRSAVGVLALLHVVRRSSR